jgi:hypothetical protein
MRIAFWLTAAKLPSARQTAGRLTVRGLAFPRLTAARLAVAVMAAGPGIASAQQMLPPGGGLGTPSVGSTRAVQPQAQSIAPLYAPSSSGAMPIPMMSTSTAVPFNIGPQQATLSLNARFGHESTALINSGLIWRVFPTRPEGNGTFRAIKEEKTASPVLSLPAGDYVVHVTCGLASMARTVHLKDSTREVFELQAGGIKLEGRVGDARIPPAAITFDVFQGSQFDQTTSKTPLAQGVLTGDLVVVPEGSYYIVSNYGDSNAVVRSDIRVQTGKLTEVTVSHRAALITLKLVGEHGGDAIANTSWSVITPGGDVIKESTGIFPRIVLAEGDYRAIARNGGRTYDRAFKVVTGVDGEIEVLATR